jgi:hypothetical protein
VSWKLAKGEPAVTFFREFDSAVAITRSTSADFIPRPANSPRMSTENTTSNFFDGSPEKTSAVAVPLKALTLP